ncbi:CYFA0S18e01266g1_1 [Cyberlindnera fabianii]|uniref:CYFA0S18e01266g1_1 n=1 Tax=Cyberlindnera fabianii TaxID=36022 RepID=A0A061BBZ9_CYBFA|nr:CYFA0S18e01266g1_1 [Cyberlindnera fabianii]
MGVSGLLPQLKEIQETVSLESFRGKTVAIDSYAWLHKGVMSCSWELARDQHTTRYIDYFRRKVRMLQHFGVVPYFVFDGDNFSSKGNTEDEREKNRQMKKEKAMALLSQGDKKGAYKHIVQSVDVTPQMAKSVIDYLKQADIKFVVAPYEADAQMVYLEKQGLVDGIISEDSDLLIFGAKCLLTKLNDFGECIAIRRDNFKNCRLVPVGLLNDAQLRMVACLSGCDYTDGIPGIGIVTAFKLVKRLGTLQKCVMNLRLEGKVKVPEEFELEYQKADISFQFQRVFDPVTNTVTTLSAVPESLSRYEHLEECIGHFVDEDTHRKIAHGELDPITKRTLLSRETSLLTPSAQVAKKTESMPEIRAKRAFTTPSSKCIKNWSIDSFFNLSQPCKKSSSWTETSSTSTSESKLKLSPTSKRRRLFAKHESEAPLTSSKFFQKRVPSVPVPDAVAVGPLNSAPGVTNGAFQAKSVLDNMPSSDYELSDPDDNEQTSPATSEEPIETERSVPHVAKEIDSGCVSSIFQVETEGSPTIDVNDSLEDDSTVHESPCRRIVGATVIEPSSSSSSASSVALVKKGLLERYGFRSESFDGKSSATTTAERTPLARLPDTVTNKTVTSSSGKAGTRSGMTRIKTKRGVSRNLTLDAFAYRG